MGNYLKIGLFGGTFDPPHFGHINLAVELQEKHRLDQVWFIPAKISPHKLDSCPAEITHRLSMLEIAIRELPSFRIKDLESSRQGPSYTIDTLKFLLDERTQENKDKQFFLLLGEDAVQGFFDWKKPAEIIKRVPLLIASRSGSLPFFPADADKCILHAICDGMTKTRVMEISSSGLRRRLADKLYCCHLAPSQVLEYIVQHRLYTRYS